MDIHHFPFLLEQETHALQKYVNWQHCVEWFPL